MASVGEALGERQSPLASALAAGVDNISQSQSITFNKYYRVVLPIDGFVFWVKSYLVSPDSVPAEDAGSDPQSDTFVVTQGSLHYTTERKQDEAENYAVNRVVFTAEKPVDQFDQIGPNMLWIGELGTLRFAFSSQGYRYQQAGLWHYSGDAVYPDMRPQIVDQISDLSDSQIVSNSLPIWLSMNGYVAKPWEPFGNSLPLFPSYLLPSNISPPWAAVHIEPRSTQAIAAAPTFAKTWSHNQFVRESVRITLFGARNDQALDFADFVQQFAFNTTTFGIMNQPVIRDEKRAQTELGAIAQKKAIDFDINYYQTRANNIARQLIVSAIPTFIF